MNSRNRLLLCVAALSGITGLALGAAATPGPAAAVPATPIHDVPVPVASPAELAAIAARIPGTKPEELRATPIAGIYELRRGAAR
jgi:hypothetical protein